MSQTEVAAPPDLRASALGARLNRSLIAAIIVGFLLRLGGGATGVLLGFYLNRVVAGSAIDPAVIAGLTAAFFVVELILAPVFGSWSDHIGRKPFLLAGPLIAAIAVQLHPLTTLLIVIFAGRILEGLATSATTPGTLGYLSDVTSGAPALRGRVMGLYELGTLVGIVLGPALGGQLWDLMGRNGLRLVSLVDLLAALLVVLFIRESRPVAAAGTITPTHLPGWREQLHNYAGLLRLPRLWRFAPAWIAINAVVGLWFNHAGLLMSRRDHDPIQLLQGGWSGVQVRNAFLLFGLAFMVGIYFWSRQYARRRKTNMMLIAIAGGYGVALVMFGINMQVAPGPWAQWPLVPLLLLALFAESGFTPVALAYLADITEGRVQNRGAVMGLYSVFLALGQVTGAALGVPFITALGFNGLLLCTAVLTTIAGLAVLNLRRQTGD